MIYLLTGGTGSFGRAFTRHMLDNSKTDVIRIFSRDELKQGEMYQDFEKYESQLRFLLGDVRDFERVKLAMRGVDIVVHAAALKQVPAAEYNPFEVVRTNIGGTENVIRAAIESPTVKKMVFISTDKACAPVTLYGSTKLVAERLVIQANTFSVRNRPVFSCVRYGNVIGSRGSVIPVFKRQASEGELTITDARMTRFWITLDQACAFVSRVLGVMKGGEIFVPAIPSAKVLDIAEAVAPKTKRKFTGIRPGEKLHECLVTQQEAPRTKAFAGGYVIEPETLGKYTRHKELAKMPWKDDFELRSDNNPIGFMGEEQIRRMI